MLAPLFAAVALAAPAPILAGAPSCPVFPASSPWNQRVDRLPTASNSTRIVAAVGADRPLHPDFGTGRIGIPYKVVGRAQKKVGVTFDYADESDKGPYPIPADPPIEAGGDRHVLLVDRDACRLYELYAAERRGGRWHAGSGAIFDLRSNRLRPAGWTSADAAGLPILPGLARYEEVRAGAIHHALRFTAPRTRKAYVYPARHSASSSTDPSLPPMGLRVRLRSSFDTSGYPRQARIVLQALKTYGMILADNGSPWFVSGAPSPGWDDDELHALSRVTGADLQVVNVPAREVTGRYAPSPTGRLHLGNLRTALLAWLFARSAGSAFLLRIEDLDAGRVRASHEAQQLEDLRAIGLDWDGEPVRQSQRGELYARAAARLDTYPCFCTRAEIREAASAPHGALPEGAYPGTCRSLTAAQRAERERSGRPAALRVRAGAPVVAVDDLLRGRVESVVDDFVIRRNDGAWAYNLAVVVDDAAQGVEQVVRGADLLDGAPRQAWLAGALGAPAPAYAHVPLVRGPDGARLAKRHGAVTLGDRPEPPAEVRALLARSLGLAAPGEVPSTTALVARLNAEALPSKDWILAP